MKKIFLVTSLIIVIILIVLLLIYVFSNDNKVEIFINKFKENNTTYIYTEENKLKEIKTPNLLTNYEFDQENRRIIKTVNGQIIEKYLWLEDNKLLAILDKNNNIKQFFNYKNKNDFIPFRMTQNGENYYFVFDKMKSLKLIIDSKNNVVKVLDYDENGNILFDSNPDFSVPFGFAGGLYDKENKLLYFKEGIYNTQFALWLTKIKKYDLIENLKQLNSINKYDVYQCADTLDTYYHSYICTNNQCGGLYASNYLEYFNAQGEILDNSYYFNKKICKKIEPTNIKYDQKLFSECVNKRIQPQVDMSFDVLKHNCHDEVNNIVEECTKESIKKD